MFHPGSQIFQIIWLDPKMDESKAKKVLKISNLFNFWFGARIRGTQLAHILHIPNISFKTTWTELTLGLPFSLCWIGTHLSFQIIRWEASNWSSVVVAMELWVIFDIHNIPRQISCPVYFGFYYKSSSEVMYWPHRGGFLVGRKFIPFLYDDFISAPNSFLFIVWLLSQLLNFKVCHLQRNDNKHISRWGQRYKDL